MADDLPPCPDGYRRNTGTCPEEAKGKRVYVILRNGEAGDWSDGYPPGWAADGRGGCSWKLRAGYPFDIIYWKLTG